MRFFSIVQSSWFYGWFGKLPGFLGACPLKIQRIHPAWHEQSSKHSVDCYPETSFHSGKTFLMIVAKHMCRLDTFVADPGGLVMQFFLMQASIDWTFPKSVATNGNLWGLWFDLKWIPMSHEVLGGNPFCSAGKPQGIAIKNRAWYGHGYSHFRGHVGSSTIWRSQTGFVEVSAWDWRQRKKTSQHNTPRKINMKPKNHPFRKENDLPNLCDYVPC